MYTWGGGFILICSKNPVPSLCVRVCVCLRVFVCVCVYVCVCNYNDQLWSLLFLHTCIQLSPPPFTTNLGFLQTILMEVTLYL